MRYKTKTIDNSLQQIITGLNTAADIIISTMGGSGKNVILSKPDDLTHLSEINFTKDGVSVARNIVLPDPIQNIGASLLINAANKTVEQCGDGTTATVLFVKSLINSEYLNDIDDKNEFLDDLDLFLEQFETIINDQSKQVESIDDIYRIAMTSCKSPKIANLIKEIYIKTGFKANISLEESRASDHTYYELVEGLNFESGMVNTRFANQDNGSCVLENAIVLIEKQAITNNQPYYDILDACVAENKAIIIIAPMFSEAFIKYAVTNKGAIGLKICLVKTPGYGSYQKENIRDINAFTTDNEVNKVVITQHDVTFFNHPQLEKINKRVAQLTKLAENAVEDYDEKDYLDRVHRLQQTGAIIYVGGVTEKNAKEEYDRIEDALGATSAAIKYGYVRGAGVELIQIIPLFKELKIFPLIEEVLTKPYTQILSNANITRTLKTDIPFNVKTKTYDENIIDPTGVILNSLRNAISLFKLLINTSYIVHNE
jgi:chaperonin GroEL